MTELPGADRILADYDSLITSFFGRRCANPDDAEDLVQEARCAIVGALGRFRGKSAVSTWVHAICRNVWSRWCRDQARLSHSLPAIGTLMAAVAEQGGGAQEETLIALAAILEKLAPGDLGLYRLFYVEGRTVREIGALTGRPEGTVKCQLWRLRSRIRAELG